MIWPKSALHLVLGVVWLLTALLVTIPTAQAGDAGAQAAHGFGNWPLHGRTNSGARYSPLKQVNTANVNHLGLAWAFDTGSSRGLEATPLVIGGKMYVTGTWSVVYALDAATGRQLWKFDPAVPRTITRKTCCDVVNRGVAFRDGRLFVATLDGRLIALDADSGKPIWSTMTVDPSKSYTITGAPCLAKNLVIIGNAGGEFGMRGYVSAYSADTGKLAWRFYTVPGNPAKGFENPAMAMAAKTWHGEWWKLGGGGPVWNSIVYDPELDLLYIGVGNGSPWNRDLRSPGGGDNLFTNSIVALHPETGKYVWHYQVVPAGNWDYDATQNMILTDLVIDGQRHKVLMMAPKSGFFMVIDRVTGKFISAKPFVKVTWASHYDPHTGRPVELASADYGNGRALVMPSPGGAHNWQPMAWDQDRKLVFIPAMDSVFAFKGLPQLKVENDLRNTGVDRTDGPPGDALFQYYLHKEIAHGFLLAWDPVEQRERWRVDLPSAWNGGVLATAGGLVFQGSGNAIFSAYRATDGKRLWQFKVEAGVQAPPITYTVGGKQYIAVAAGWGGAYGLAAGIKPKHPPRSRIVAFRLNAAGRLPAPSMWGKIPDPPARMDVDTATLAHGEGLYANYCSYCHGAGAISGGSIPDLRWLPAGFHNSFDKIVLDGALSRLGMPAFGDVLDPDDARTIHAWLIERAHEDKAVRELPEWQQKLLKSWYIVKAKAYGLFIRLSSKAN